MKIKKLGILTLKLLIVTAALYYLVSSGKLDFSRLAVSAEEIPNMLMGGACIAALILLSFVRHFLLLKGGGINFSIGDTFRVGIIGNFFNTFMPGGLGGDVVKIGYIVHETGKRANTIASVMIDRIMGLLGLFSLGGVAMLANWEEVQSTPSLHGVSLLIFGILGITGFCLLASTVSIAKGRKTGLLVWSILVVIAGIATYIMMQKAPIAFSDPTAPLALLRGRAILIIALSVASSLFCIVIAPSCQPGRRLEGILRDRIPIGKQISHLIQSVLIYRENFLVVIWAYVISIMVQGLALLSIYIFGTTLSLDPEPSIKQVFFAAPAALLVNTLPISFGGLGVGEVAMERIMAFCRSPEGISVSGGATMFLVLRCWTIMYSLIGLPVYLRGKAKIKEAEEEYLAEISSDGKSTDV